ncbi:uncharacterized protein [Periplaneta americana]|uniref:uncharacterized protein n=1 Tax=Periplaneta americana TaxID=6978 RepID=UPI0037E7CA01
MGVESESISYEKSKPEKSKTNKEKEIAQIDRIRKMLADFMIRNGEDEALDTEVERQLLARVEKLEKEVSSQETIKEKIRKLEDCVSQLLLREEDSRSEERHKESYVQEREKPTTDDMVPKVTTQIQQGELKQTRENKKYNQHLYQEQQEKYQSQQLHHQEQQKYPNHHLCHEDQQYSNQHPQHQERKLSNSDSQEHRQYSNHSLQTQEQLPNEPQIHRKSQQSSGQKRQTTKFSQQHIPIVVQPSPKTSQRPAQFCQQQLKAASKQPTPQTLQYFDQDEQYESREDFQQQQQSTAGSKYPIPQSVQHVQYLDQDDEDYESLGDYQEQQKHTIEASKQPKPQTVQQLQYLDQDDEDYESQRNFQLQHQQPSAVSKHTKPQNLQQVQYLNQDDEQYDSQEDFQQQLHKKLHYHQRQVQQKRDCDLPVRDTDSEVLDADAGTTFNTATIACMPQQLMTFCQEFDLSDSTELPDNEIPKEVDALRSILDQERRNLKSKDRRMESCKKECTELKKKLKMKREEQNEMKHCHYTLLNKAMSAISLHREHLKYLLNYSRDQDEVLREKLTLQSVIQSGDCLMAQVLLDAGDDVNGTDQAGFTPLHDVAGGGYVALAEILIDAGANLEARATGGITPLHQAAMYGQLPMCRLLLDKGCVVDPKSDFNSTPLHYAAENGYLEVVKLLVKHGADVNSTDSGGVTAWEDATRSGHTSVAMWLAQNFPEEDQRYCFCGHPYS